MTPKLSILTPVWNQETLVIRTLGSIPRRDDIEVIVRDDGSSDNTLANLREYAGITKEVVSAGVNNKVEIWSKDRYEAGATSYEEMGDIMEHLTDLGIRF